MVAVLSACGFQLPARTVAVASVQDTLAHPKAKQFTLTAVSHPDLRGVGQWTTRSPRARTATVHERWVVPLTDPGQTVEGEVSAWVTYTGKVLEGDSAAPFIDALKSGLDGKEVTLPVSVRVGERPDSAWEKAVRNAEQRFGIRSRKGAPVLRFPL